VIIVPVLYVILQGIREWIKGTNRQKDAQPQE